MEQIANSKPFDILVTHVWKEHGLVKIIGQTDIPTGQVVEKYLVAVADQLEGGSPPVIESLEVGQVVVASRDCAWFRAKVVNLESTGDVSLYFLDHGNKCSVNLSNIRTGVHSQLNQVQPLAHTFLLAEVVPPGGDWSKPALEFIADALVNDICRAAVTHRARGYTFARLFRRDCREPLINDMVQCGMAVPGFPNMDIVPPAHNYVQPPALSVPQQPPMFPAPISPNYPPPLSIRVPPLPPPHMTGPPPTQFLSAPPTHRTPLFRPMHLETGTWYTVFLSSTEGGPADFSIQLESLSKKLTGVMESVNSTDLRLLPVQAIQAGVPCLARYTLDNTIYRAVVLKRDSMAKVYYLDFGNSESLPLDQVYAIPPNLLNTQMLSVRCSVYQWPELEVQDKVKAKQRFDTYTDRPLNCRVVSAEAGTFASARTVVQLYEDGTDLGQEIRLWVARQQNQPGTGGRHGGRQGVHGNHSLTYDHTSLVGVNDVHLSHLGSGPSQFYVTRADQTSALSSLMREICDLKDSGSLFPLSSAPTPGIPCLARYSDNVWYRVTVIGNQQTSVKVFFVDYGNTEFVTTNMMCAIPPGLVTRLPSQAVSVRLSGFGPHTQQNDRLIETFKKLLGKVKFRLKVEGGEVGGVYLVQAFTLPPPGSNINAELSKLVKGGSRSTTPQDLEELRITWWENCNNFYGQYARLTGELDHLLSQVSDYCHNQSNLVYQGSLGQNHKGRIVAVPDNKSDRFIRARIVRDNLRGNKVEVSLLDIGGHTRVDKTQVWSLPSDLARQPEFGILCTLGVQGNQGVNGDNKLRNSIINEIIEIKRVRKSGEHILVTLTDNTNKSLRNTTIIDFCRSDGQKRSIDNERLNELFERQNNKYNNRMNDQMANNGRATENGHEEVKKKNFERGDLRNSLREKRAAKELALKNKSKVTSLRSRNLKIGFKGKCKITWMYNPGHFYIQVSDLPSFEAMMGNLQVAALEADVGQLTKGSPLAARWTDGCWYRGQAESVPSKGNKLEIFFVDFGNTETVNEGEIRGLPSEFSQLDCQAVKVGLAGIEPAMSAGWEQERLAKYFQQDKYHVEVIRENYKDGKYLVHLNNGEVSRAMVRDGLAKATEAMFEKVENGKKIGKGKIAKEVSSDSDARSEVSSCRGDVIQSVRKTGNMFSIGDFPPISSKQVVGKLMTGVVSHINSWKEFWFQPDPELVTNMAGILNNKGKTVGKPVVSIEEGECCLAICDHVWYRAAVIEKGNPVIVQLVDYGKTVSLPLSEIRAGEFSLYETHPGAIRCKLDKKLENFDKLMESTKSTAILRGKHFQNNQFVVKMEKDKREKKSKDKPADKRLDITVVHVEKVDRVWFVTKDKLPMLENLMAELTKWMEDDSNIVVLDEVEVGQICCVSFSQDGGMYRAKVVWVDDNTAEVLFFDYGNSEEVDIGDIFELPSQFREQDPAGMEIRVKDADFVLDTEEIRQKLETALAKDKVSIQITNGEGTFFIDGKKLGLERVLKSKDTTVNMFQICGSPRVECCISFAEHQGESGFHLWVVSQELQHNLDTLMAKLQGEARGFGTVNKVSPGDLVCAKYSQDLSYYRARVIGRGSGESVEIHYIDFGNKELVDIGSLKSLPIEFRLHPGFAMEVIVDSTGDCRMTGPGEIQQMIIESKQVVAELVQPRGGVVRMYVGGERMGLQVLASVAGLTIPPIRLRPEEVWLARLTSASSKGLALQNIWAAAKVTDSLAKGGLLDQISTKPRVGELYINQVQPDLHRRIVVQEVGKEMIIACAIDSQQMISLPLDDCPISSWQSGTRVPPAALSAAPLTTKTKDKYQLPNRLFRVTVSENRLMLVDSKWTLSALFSSQPLESFSEIIHLPLMSSNHMNFSLNLPNNVNWTASLLSSVRDKSIKSALNVEINQEDIVTVAENELSVGDILDSLSLAFTGMDSTLRETSGLLPQLDFPFNTNTVTNPPSQEAEVEGGEIHVKQHPNMPAIRLKNGECSSFTILEKGKDKLVISTCKKIAVEELTKGHVNDEDREIELCDGEVCLYNDGTSNYRAIIIDKIDDSIDIYLLDSGKRLIADIAEISHIPDNQRNLPPSAFVVQNLVSDVQVGDDVQGHVKLSESGILEIMLNS